MDEKSNVFSEEYATESSTVAPSRTAEEEKQDQTIAGKFDDKSKPHRVIIRAKEIR